MPAGDLGRHLQHGPHAELVTAEHPRLDDPIEAGLQQRLMNLFAVVATLVGLFLLLAKQRDQRFSAPDCFGGREVGLGRGDGGRSPFQHCSFRHPPLQSTLCQICTDKYQPARRRSTHPVQSVLGSERARSPIWASKSGVFGSGWASRMALNLASANILNSPWVIT